MPIAKEWTVIDLFSGAGGMSYGFHAHEKFRVIGGADAQIGKPSSGAGSLDCNLTFNLNIGVKPHEVDLGKIEPSELFKLMGSERPTVLSACSPCTGFSRTLSSNHINDDIRNSLVVRTGDFVKVFQPSIFLMENARELLQGNFTHHFKMLRDKLEDMGYEVSADVHFLNEFGLPQRRERAIVIAVKEGLPICTLDDLWGDCRAAPDSTTVRRAISKMPAVKSGTTHPADEHHASPNFTKPTLYRLQSIPRNGGSWIDLRHLPDADDVLTPAMKRYIARGKLGSHPDVYGRMWWDRPAPTIKRECGHTGNGRYAHPEQDRLCTVREMAILQGFPTDFQFAGPSLGNMYRHIGDAVPPLISYQLAQVCSWILSGRKPSLPHSILKKTHLSSSDIKPMKGHQRLLFTTSAS